AVAAEGDRPDVAVLVSVLLDGLEDRRADLVRAEGQLEAEDLARLEEARDVRVEREHRGALRRRVGADAFEDARSVVEPVSEDVALRLVPGDERGVHPDVGRGSELHGGRVTGSAGNPQVAPRRGCPDRDARDTIPSR